MKQTLTDYILEELDGVPEASGSGNIPARCISCGHDKHMYVNSHNGLTICFRCGYSANLVKLIADNEGLDYTASVIKAQRLLRGYGTHKHTHAASVSNADFAHEIRDAIINLDANQSPVFDTDSIKRVLPKYCVPIEEKIAARRGRRYLIEERGMERSRWKPYELYYCVARDEDYFADLSKHIIFPERDALGNIVHFTTRATFNPTRGAKSYHPKGSKSALYGLSLIPKKQNWVILVEGPMDVIALSRHAVALMGKTVTDAQIRLLKSRFTSVYICLDKEEQEASWELAQKLHAHGLKCSVTHTPRKDAAECSDLPVLDLVEIIMGNGRAFTPSNLIKQKLKGA